MITGRGRWPGPGTGTRARCARSTRGSDAKTSGPIASFSSLAKKSVGREPASTPSARPTTQRLCRLDLPSRSTTFTESLCTLSCNDVHSISNSSILPALNSEAFSRSTILWPCEATVRMVLSILVSSSAIVALRSSAIATRSSPKARVSSVRFDLQALAFCALCRLATSQNQGCSPSLDSTVNTTLHLKVHKLITYSFHHKTVTQLLLSIGVLVPLCGGIEKSVGTVRFLLMFLLLSISTGVLYTILGLLLFGASAQKQVEGFIPVSLSLMGMATVHSRMVKGFLFGVTVPMLALPWLFLFIITLLVPHTVFLCNAIAIIAGGIYGKGWLSLLDMSDARASVLDKKMPFRLLRNIGVLYVPASTEERRKTVHPPIIPTPGSYPVQAYAPVSFTSNLQATETTPKTFEGWANSYYTQGSPVQLSGYNGHNHGYGLKHSFGPSHGHSHEHGHSCSHSQGHGHSHEHSFGHGLSHGHASASQTSSHWAPVAQHPHSQHSHLSPLSVSVSAPQSFTAKMPESLPESVMVHPGAPVSSLTD